MRRGRKSGNNGNDYRYKGKRGIFLLIEGSSRLPMGGWGWSLWLEEGTDDQYDEFSINL